MAIVPKISKEQLRRLTREEKMRLLDAVEEKRRRAKEARAAFIPHEGQRTIILDGSKIRVLTCGNGFGKTALGANEAIWAALGWNPVSGRHTSVPARVIVVLDTPAKVSDVWLPEIRKWYPLKEDQLNKLGKPFISQITFDNGSEIRFMFHLQEDLAFESIEADFVVFDEPPPRQVWVGLLRSGRKKGSQPRFLLLGTPIAQPWLREYHVDWERGLYPDTKFFKFSTALNEGNLAAGYIKDFTRHLTDREKRTRIDGDFFSADGLALAETFNRSKHVVPISPELKDKVEGGEYPCVIAIDPHPQKPTHACLMAVGPNGQKYYVAECALKLTPRDFANWLHANWLHMYRIVDIICDNFGSGEFTGGEGFKSFIEVLRSAGVAVRPTSYDEKLDSDFVTRLLESLYVPEGGTPLLQIFKGNRGIIRDIENVSWVPQKNTEEYKPKLDIGNKDFLACLKYALAANLTFGNAKKRVIRAPAASPWAGKAPQIHRVMPFGDKKWGTRAKAIRKNNFFDDDDE